MNSIEVLTPMALIYSNIRHDEFALINNVLNECDDMKEETKHSNDIQKFKLYIKQFYLIVLSVEKTQKVKPKICKNKKRKNNVYITLCGLSQ